jgi:VRR-NUC domain
MRPAALFSLRNPRQHPESNLQRAVCQWWAAQYPRTWALTFHCPSGVAIDPKRAAVFKGLGWKRGVPDLLCFARRGNYVGLALELKADQKGKASIEQQQWLAALEAQGWRVGVFYDHTACRDFLDQYHALAEWRPRDPNDCPRCRGLGTCRCEIASNE